LPLSENCKLFDLKVDFEAALKDYEEALKLDKDMTVAKYNRGTIWYRMGKYQEALADLQEAVNSDSDNKEYQEALVKCQAELE